MNWLKKVWSFIVSRLSQMHSKMKGIAANDQLAKAKEEATKFQSFYNSAYYAVFKKEIEEQLNALDRQKITDPGRLILIQGERNALMGILDQLNRKERMVNSTLREKS